MQTIIRNTILVHFAILCLIGFYFYDRIQIYYIGLQLSTILIYATCLNIPLNGKNKILIQGLIFMTALETFDYIFNMNTYDPFNPEHSANRLFRDGVIVVILSILTAIRYFKHGRVKT